MENDEDDWLFDSVKNYHNLFMYDLQQAVTCMDWSEDKSLIIATHGVERNEIIELSVPEKLIIEEDENMGLLKDRDFHQKNGGMSTSRICCIKHIPQTRQVCTSDEDNSGVKVWKLGSAKTDLITEVGHYMDKQTKDKMNGTRGVVRIAVSDSKPGSVIFGANINKLCYLDTEVGKTTNIFPNQESCSIEYPESISEIEYLDTNTILCCCEKSGNLVLVDIREKGHKSLLTNVSCKGDSYWTMNVTADLVYRLSASGKILVSDVRNGTDSVITEMDLQFHCLTKEKDITIQSSPKHKNTVSVSGFDGNIYVFDTQRPPMSTCGSFYTEPIFTHEGHVKNCEDQPDLVKSSSHLWHPWKPDLLISSASDNSLHAWEYCLHTT